MYGWDPAWREHWTIAEAEAELEGFKFRGCGIYCTDTDTMLVYAVSEDRGEFMMSPTELVDMATQKFHFLVWNAKLHDTILGVLKPSLNYFRCEK